MFALDVDTQGEEALALPRNEAVWWAVSCVQPPDGRRWGNERTTQRLQNTVEETAAFYRKIWMRCHVLIFSKHSFTCVNVCVFQISL